ncbi:DUF305 domain-containing protein [Deinococcus ruber]|uniref:DUF305 domain-containing protein n=1 Tax=Deinococcus ruber TaxID=1848197 RepID=A0A918FE17_9DEIO|nr:DUF305 domain-containing protein [Deinococcus ruber]GGR27191.1 hypothetical protein GCM10008957_43190 [Deinococcus ruber]
MRWGRWLIAAALPLLGWWLGQQRFRPPGESSPDVRFARDMSVHHSQAVQMSVMMLKRSSNPALRLLTQDITLTQQAQIGQMSGWLMAWGRPLSGQTSPPPGLPDMGLASKQELQRLETLPLSVAEPVYLAMMKRHHLGAVRLAQAALKSVQRPEVRAFAARLVTAQTAEVAQIDALLKTRMSINAPVVPETTDVHHE